MPEPAPGTIIADALNLRSGPGTEHAVLATLRAGEAVAVTAAIGEWYCVETARGPGFVHGDFVELAPGAAIPAAGAAGAIAESPYVVVAGDSLSAIGARRGVDWRAIAAANGIEAPYVLHPGQVLRIPGAPPRIGELEVLDPLSSAGASVLTSSSANGHHRPWGGDHAADLDVANRDSPGCEVRFHVALAGGEVRGVVDDVRAACHSLRLADGGYQLRLRIERRAGEHEPWLDTGAWLRYAHLDPVAVVANDVVAPGGALGWLGPAGGGEYASSCAMGSHVHVEALRATWVAPVGTTPGDGPFMRIGV